MTLADALSRRDTAVTLSPAFAGAVAANVSANGQGVIHHSEGAA